jgi:hypothetical protein
VIDEEIKEDFIAEVSFWVDDYCIEFGSIIGIQYHIYHQPS